MGHGHAHTHSHSHESKSIRDDEEDVGFINVVTDEARSDFIMSVKEIKSLKKKANQHETADQTLLDSTSSVLNKKSGCHILCKYIYIYIFMNKLVKNNLLRKIFWLAKRTKLFF